MQVNHPALAMDSWLLPAGVVGAVGVSVALQFALSRAGAASAPDKRRTNLHVLRKVQHAGTGMLFAAVLEAGMPLRLGAALLLGAAAAFLAVHLARLVHPPLQAAFLAAFAGIMREHERHSLPGAAYFLAGCGAVAACAPRPLVVAAILAVSVGDPVASAVGIAWGGASRRAGCEPSPSRRHALPCAGAAVSCWRHKSLAGAAAGGLAVAASVALYFAAVARADDMDAWLAGAPPPEGGWLDVEGAVAAALSAPRGTAGWCVALPCAAGGGGPGPLPAITAALALAAAAAEALEVHCPWDSGSSEKDAPVPPVAAAALALLGDDNLRVPLAAAAAGAAAALLR